MITDSRQEWGIGCRVRVGFLSLIVMDYVQPCGDGYPGQYILGRVNHTTGEPDLYTFTPHHGLSTGVPYDYDLANLTR